MPRLAIIGLGLIGGSIGLALKRAQLPDLEIVGHDAEWGVNRKARKLGAIDSEARTPESAVEGATLTVIATPILQVRPVLERIASALGEGVTVTDTASTKRDVLAWAEELLPDTVNFIGGHPIAGTEQAGIDAADADLFQRRPWAISPSIRASEQAIQSVEDMITLTGARPTIIDAAEHDSYLAAVSHLPLIVSSALFSLTSGSQAWPELAALAGPGFESTTRLASSSPSLSHDISLTNRENLLHWLDRFDEELRRFRALVADTGDQPELFEAFATVQTARDAFLEAPPEKPGPDRPTDRTSAGERMMAFMVGDYVVRRTKELQKLLDNRESDAEQRRKRGRR